MANGTKVRQDVARMDSNHPMLRSYIDAVEQMKGLPSSDPRSWERQASIHQDHCPHGNWYFLPWHRAYLSAFEAICRDLSGNPDFALPYWNWTKDPSIPAPFWQGTLLDESRSVGPSDRIGDEFVGQRIIDAILTEPEFELFGSSMPFGQDGTDERWQRVRGANALLEGTPHNSVHRWISGNMATLMSPRDPIFWLHHCNIDRLWAEWNARGFRNTANAYWRDFQFRQNFVRPDRQEYDVYVRDLEDMAGLGYTYDTLPAPALEAFAALAPERAAPSEPVLQRARSRFARAESRAAAIGSPASFSIETPESAVPLVEGAFLRAHAADDHPRVLALIQDVEQPAEPDITVNVFLNCPYLAVDTPPSDPHFVGSFNFFPVPNGGDNGHEGGHDMKRTYAFDLTETVDQLRAQHPELEAELTVQLMPVPLAGRNVPSVEIEIGGVEILYL